MTNKIDKSFMGKPSRPFTNSALEELMPGYFMRLDLSDELPLIQRLEDARRSIVAGRDKCNSRAYDPALDKSFAEDRVGQAALDQLLSEGEDRPVATGDENTYRLGHLQFSELTAELAEVLNRVLKPRARMQLFQSGRHLYPQNGYMGWHTNSNVPGFRLYLSHVEAGNSSGFRYRDPDSGNVVSDWDEAGWNFRCFRTDLSPFWHSVWSHTDRISLGYGIKFPFD